MVVHGVVYAPGSQARAVISNTDGQHRSNIVWRVKPERLGFAPTSEVTVKDTTSGRVKARPWSALTDGSIKSKLPAFGYRLFEIRPG